MKLKNQILIEAKEERKRRLKRERMKAYRQTPKGIAYRKAYRSTSRYKATHRATQRAYRRTPEGIAYRKNYQQSPAGRASQKNFRKSIKFKLLQHAHEKKPQRIAYKKVYLRKYQQLPRVKDAQKAYRQTPEFKAVTSKRMRLRRKNDPAFKMIGSIRRRILESLKGRNKTVSTIELLGCTIERARTHLENQFKPGWCWANHGKVWHIDHVRPLASFKVMDETEQRVAFHYTNLQPLLGIENLKKGSLYNGVRHKTYKNAR